MNRLILFILLFTTSFSQLHAQENFLIDAYNRPSQSLDGAWNYIVDPYENGFYNYRLIPFEELEDPGAGAYFTNAKPVSKSDLVEYNYDMSDTLHVPGDWNTQKEKLFYYEGTVWYKKSFDYAKANPDDRTFLYFGAVNYQADVYLNGKKLGRHIGGFTPFNFEVTNLLNEKDNFVVVKVDNTRAKDAVPTLNTDWWNYGGITRSVELITTPATFIRDFLVQLDADDTKKILFQVELDGNNKAQQKVKISIPELKVEKELLTDDNGIATAEFQSKKIVYWSPENPKLYEVTIATAEDKLTDEIGFRTIKTEGINILLNDEKIFLKGISIHEESPFGEGRANSAEDAVQLLSWAKELGCNYVRLAHYPHNEHMVRMADKMGMMVWEEIPVYWTISWDNEETYLNAENQLTEMISRDKNRACVIIWSMANETPNSEARNVFLGRLAEKTRSLDKTRLISAALEQTNYEGNPDVQTIDDPYAEVVDILSFNQYIGWYAGLPERCSEISWKITQNKPVLISEFGAGAKYGFHGDSLTRWTEEYQEYLYIETLKMIDQIPQLQGFSPWVLVDFRSPRRPLAEIQDGWNRKGLLSEKGEKKKAFYILQEYYQAK
jgi:beta-glucuronidase